MKKDAMQLKESIDGYVGWLEGDEERESDVIILSQKQNKTKTNRVDDS